jgi:hypothetical protein
MAGYTMRAYHIVESGVSIQYTSMQEKKNKKTPAKAKQMAHNVSLVIERV